MKTAALIIVGQIVFAAIGVWWLFIPVLAVITVQVYRNNSIQ